MDGTDFDPFEPGEQDDSQTAEGSASLVDSLEKGYDTLGDSEGVSSSETDSGKQAGDGDRSGEAGYNSRDLPRHPADEGSGQADSDGAKLTPLEAPANWALADREMFGRLTPDAQHWLAQRSQAMDAAHTQRSQAIAPMRRAYEAFAPVLQHNGVTFEQAVQGYLEATQTLRFGTPEAKINFLRKIITDFGITGEGVADENAPPRDPRVDHLLAQQQQQQAYMQQQQQMAQQSRIQNVSQEVQSFRGEIGEDGKLKHPYFGEVIPIMRELATAALSAGQQPRLHDLYDRACWQVPAIREKLIAAQTAEGKAKQAEELRKKRNAGSSISGAGSRSPVNRQKSLIESLSEGWDQQSAA